MNIFRVKDIDDSQAPLLDHLIELRTRTLATLLEHEVAERANRRTHHRSRPAAADRTRAERIRSALNHEVPS